jgi:hypothetical protein
VEIFEKTNGQPDWEGKDPFNLIGTEKILRVLENRERSFEG